MSARPFPPLVLDLPAGRRTVASAYEALECLEAAWPITTGNAYRWAIQRAFDALDGFVEPEVARAALDGAPRTLTGGATHYHTTAVSPSWAARFPQTAQIGVHLFYRQPVRTASN